MLNSEKYVSSLITLFKGDLPADQLIKFMDETVSFFQNLQQGMQAKEQDVRDKAVEDMMQIQQILEENIEMICEKTGLNLSELMEFAQDPKNMTAAQLEKSKELKEHFQKIQEDTLKNETLLNNKNIG